MASASLPNPCVKCSKGRAQILCSGCQQWLCFKHLNEHRQELSHEMDHLTQQHDELHREILSHLMIINIHYLFVLTIGNNDQSKEFDKLQMKCDRM